MVKMTPDTIGDDLFVDTKGHCFICLDKVGSAQVPFKLKYFSRCLRLNGKVFARDKKETEDIPGYLEKGERSKVLLCEECGFISGQYSDVYQQLEEIELKVLFLTDLIERRMRKGETDGNLSLKPSDLEAFHYAEKVRKEVMDKCSLKLKESRPRIRLCKVPGLEVLESHRSAASCVAGKIKREELQLPEVMNGDDSKKTPSYLLNRLGLNLDGTPKDSLNGRSKSFHSSEHSVTGSAIKKTKKHDCDLCDASLDTLNDLQSHRNEVHFGKTFKCVAPCNKVMGSRKALNVHHKRCAIYKGALAEDLEFGNEGQNRILVNTNGNSSSLENGVEVGAAPVQTHNVKRLLNPSTPKAKTGQGNSRKCKGCGKMFPNFACAKQHYNRVHSLQPFSCSICKRKFSQKQHLDSHKRACHIAKKKYTNVKNKNNTMKTENVNDKIASVLRTMGMSKASNAGKSEVATPTKHSQLNGQALSKTCKACGKVFGSYANAKRHYNNVHLKMLLFECDICKRKFGVKETLQRHYRTVHKGLAIGQTQDKLTVGPMKPMAAPKRSANGQKLSSKTKPIQSLGQGRTCKVCRRKFSSFLSCQRHYNSVHLKLRFKCEVCHKTFTRNDTLISHQRKAHPKPTDAKKVPIKKSKPKKKTNGNEKTSRNTHRFSCNICGNKYTELGNLNRHMRAAHLEGSIKFSCDFPGCGKKFRYKINLKRHQKTHIQLQFPCLQPCQLVFNYENELNEHQKTCETFQSA